MNSRYLINTEGAFLKPSISNKPFSVLKTDLLNHILWKPSKKSSVINKIKKLERFKTRFLKN